MTKGLAAIVVAGVVVFGTCSAQAKTGHGAGVLDPSFGSFGRVITNFGSSADGIGTLARQQNGKIIAGGVAKHRMAVARYEPNGSLDKTFGESGLALVKGGHVAGVAVQPDGKIVAAGTGGDDLGLRFVVYRFDPGGHLDMTFGMNGVVITEIGAWASARGVVLQRDGKIIVAGTSQTRETRLHHEFALARYSPDGSLDPSFGSGGVATTSIGRSAEVTGIRLQPDGKVLVGGSATSEPAEDRYWDFAVARYAPDGRLDQSFGTGGVVTTTSGPGIADYGHALAVERNGRAVLVGYSYDDGLKAASLSLLRYKPDGSLDPSFGTGGKAQTKYNGELNAVSIQPDGKIVAVGTSFENHPAFLLARYRRNGSLDEDFAQDGIRRTSIRHILDLAHAVLRQANGRIVSAGTSYTTGTDQAFALARYLGDKSQRLRVRKRGRGKVSSKPAVLSCGRKCAAWFGRGTRVKLIAKPRRGRVVQWGGACSGRNRTCTVKMKRSRTVKVTFVRRHRR